MLGPSSVVLVVDDDADIRETMSLVLRRHGYSVATAADGAEALRRLRTDERHPCLILLDLMMPGMDGFALCQALGEGGLTGIPVVVLTGAGFQVAARAEALSLTVLRKPVALQELLAIVRRYCPSGTPPAATTLQ